MPRRHGRYASLLNDTIQIFLLILVCARTASSHSMNNTKPPRIRIAQYNPNSLGGDRVHEVSMVLRGVQVIAALGTKVKCQQGSPHFLQNTEHHHVIHWGSPRKPSTPTSLAVVPSSWGTEYEFSKWWRYQARQPSFKVEEVRLRLPRANSDSSK